MLPVVAVEPVFWARQLLLLLLFAVTETCTDNIRQCNKAHEGEMGFWLFQTCNCLQTVHSYKWTHPG